MGTCQCASDFKDKKQKQKQKTVSFDKQSTESSKLSSKQSKNSFMNFDITCNACNDVFDCDNNIPVYGCSQPSHLFCQKCYIAKFKGRTQVRCQCCSGKMTIQSKKQNKEQTQMLHKLKQNCLAGRKSKVSIVTLFYQQLIKIKYPNTRDISNLQNIKSINLFQSNLTKLHDLSGFTKLKILHINNAKCSNKIKKIQCLNNLNLLEVLRIECNQISCIENINLPNLRSLVLKHNKITKMEGFEHCPNLLSIDLSFNQISKIQGLTSCKKLIKLILQHNKIISLSGLLNLQNQFTEFNIQSNALTNIEPNQFIILSDCKILKLKNNELNVKTLQLFNSISIIQILQRLTLTYNPSCQRIFQNIIEKKLQPKSKLILSMKKSRVTDNLKNIIYQAFSKYTNLQMTYQQESQQ